MRSDWAIRFEVCDQLVRVSQAYADNVYVSVRDGLVRLSGSVPSRREHAIAVQIASHVRGVRGIDDRIEERPS